MKRVDRTSQIRVGYIWWRSQILILMNYYLNPFRLTAPLLIQQEVKPLQKFKLNFLTLTISNLCSKWKFCPCKFIETCFQTKYMIMALKQAKHLVRPVSDQINCIQWHINTATWSLFYQVLTWWQENLCKILCCWCQWPNLPTSGELSISGISTTQIPYPTIKDKSDLQLLHPDWSCVFWPDINKDIEARVQKCEICQESQNETSQKNIGATWSTHEGMAGCWNWFVLIEWGWISTHVWLLLQVSNYQEKPHGQSTCNTVVNLTKCVFSEQGVPEVIISDNGPHSDCKSCKEFSKEWGFHHFTWSPR